MSSEPWTRLPHPLGGGRWTIAHERWTYDRHGDLTDDFLPPEEGAPVFESREEAEAFCQRLT